MKTKLQKELATIAPCISIATIWEHDPGHTDIRSDCDGFDDANPDDWQAWQSEIQALAIVNGEQITGSAYLGGTWEKAGDDPAISNPEISGYENQMTIEALEGLMEAFRPLYEQHEGGNLAHQIDKAMRHCKVLG